ncbi:MULTISPECIES: histone-like nucleoid-structuring protein Lsr2 [unclassified Nocardioides]|uniref:histone-like nucleoid-structuring protein Lsr2 n=1 Tax=unclassified Nocardioides TaxID=2615069 RepID=UPI00361551D0
MAQKVQIILEDDIDGGEAVETVTFGIDGTTYEIDLNEANATRLRDALAPFVGHGRKVSGARRARKSSDSGPSAKEIRDWAREHGFDVPDRGRVSAEVRAAFEAAH